MASNTSMPSGSEGRYVLICTILASSMAFIDGSALTVALPAIQSALNATGSDLLWVVSLYLLFLSSLILVGGALGDRYGRKRMFGVGIALFTVTSVACGLAPTIQVLMVARAVQGIGAALMVPGSLSIISAYFDDIRRGEAIGTWSALSGVAGLIGPVIGGFMAERGLWRGVFLINVPLAAVALFLLVRYVPESRDESQTGRLDFVGAALATLALGGLTFGFINSSNVGFTTGNIAAIVFGLVMLVVFAIAETRIRAPMVPPELFKSRTFTGANLMTLLMYAALAAAFFMLPLNLIQVQGYSADLAALATLPPSLLLTFLSRRMGRLAGVRGPRWFLVIGPLLAGLGFAWLAMPSVTQGPPDYWTTYLPPLILVGLGLSIFVAPLTTAVMNAVSQNRSGTASGVNNAVARTANTLAIAVIGTLALATFSTSLITQTAPLELPQEARVALEVEARKLGDAQIPDTVPAAMQDEVQAAMDLAFIDAFRLAVLSAAALAIGSAIISWLTIRNSSKKTG